MITIKTKRRIKTRGFTLVEILIVIVILAIMASLVVPRIMSQSNVAYIAEAQRQLGVLKRMQNAVTDVDGVQGSWVTISASGDWAKLSLVQPPTTNWAYGCTTTACTATAQSPVPTGTIVVNTSGAFSCTGGYTTVDGAATSIKGCELS